MKGEKAERTTESGRIETSKVKERQRESRVENGQKEAKWSER